MKSFDNQLSTLNLFEDLNMCTIITLFFIENTAKMLGTFLGKYNIKQI